LKAPGEFNTKNIAALSPFRVDTEDLIQFDLERWEYVSSYLLDVGLCTFRRKTLVFVVVHDDSLPLELIEPEAPFGNSKSSIASQELTHSEQLLQQLRLASLWSFNFEEWYPGLSSVHVSTLRSEERYPILPDACFIPLSPDQITFIRRCLKKRLWYVTPFTDEDNAIIELLEENITATMKTFSLGEFSEFFVRLSGHSPKDVNLPLKVTSGKDVMNLILRSGRSLIDLEMLRKFLIRAKYQNIILLPWNSEMSIEMEFRCFVFKGNLNAISQYDFSTAYDSLQNKDIVQQIQDAIIHFHEQTVAAVRFASYVFDVFLSPKSEGDWYVKLIELNPFGGDLSSGSCLFDWEEDKHILYNPTPGKTCTRILANESMVFEITK